MPSLNALSSTLNPYFNWEEVEISQMDISRADTTTTICMVKYLERCMLEICLPRIWLKQPFKYPITSLCCHIGRQTTGVWKQITGGSNQTTAKTNQKHFWQCGTLTMISHYMNRVCVCVCVCVSLPLSLCVCACVCVCVCIRSRMWVSPWRW